MKRRELLKLLGISPFMVSTLMGIVPKEASLLSVRDMNIGPLADEVFTNEVTILYKGQVVAAGEDSRLTLNREAVDLTNKTDWTGRYEDVQVRRKKKKNRKKKGEFKTVRRWVTTGFTPWTEQFSGPLHASLETANMRAINVDLIWEGFMASELFTFVCLDREGGVHLTGEGVLTSVELSSPSGFTDVQGLNITLESSGAITQKP